MSEDRPTCSYQIDGEDRIIGVSDGWSQFAQSNDAGQLQAEAVVGRLLWDFVAGSEARQLYQLLFDQVREDGRSRTIPFRCDGPECRRYMELTIDPLPDSALEMRSVLVHEEQRVPVPLLSALVSRTGDILRMCAWCKRVNVDGEWFEVEEAVRRLDLFGAQELPMISHGICASCKATFTEAMAN